ncbi:MAG: oxidoreductase [Burkholderiales bacterium]|nr:oxidoreductase [Burkholderiales bacterium]
MVPSLAPSSTTGLNVRVARINPVAQDVIALELRACDGYALIPFAAGAHIDVELPVRDAAGHFMVRQYSLCNDPAEHDRYVVAVGRDTHSRGGSAWLHDTLKEGDTLRISTPRNHFQLVEAAPHSVLVAGGIGITPLLAMVRRLSALGRTWTLYYCTRTPVRAAFLQELAALPGTVIPVYDGVAGGKPIDLPAVLAQAAADAHLYCCGPTSLMEAFERAAGGRPSHQIHVEWFKPRPAAAAAPNAAGDDALEVKLARSAMTLPVPAGKSILDVLVEAGVSVQHSCCDGVCGTCETRVLEGVPDHRDSVLCGEDAKCTDRMMVCVSRARTPSLTLDL